MCSFLTNFSCVGHPSLQAWQQHLKLYLIQDHRKWCLQRVATCIVYLRWHFHRIVCLMVVPRMDLLPIFFRAFKSRPAVHICDLLSLHSTFHFMTAKNKFMSFGPISMIKRSLHSLRSLTFFITRVAKPKTFEPLATLP